MILEILPYLCSVTCFIREIVNNHCLKKFVISEIAMQVLFF